MRFAYFHGINFKPRHYKQNVFYLRELERDAY